MKETKLILAAGAIYLILLLVCLDISNKQFDKYEYHLIVKESKTEIYNKEGAKIGEYIPDITDKVDRIIVRDNF